MRNLSPVRLSSSVLLSSQATRRRRGEELAAAKKRKERQAQEKRSLNDLLGFMVECPNEKRRGLVDEAVAEDELVV